MKRLRFRSNICDGPLISAEIWVPLFPWVTLRHLWGFSSLQNETSGSLPYSWSDCASLSIIQEQRTVRNSESKNVNLKAEWIWWILNLWNVLPWAVMEPTTLRQFTEKNSHKEKGYMLAGWHYSWTTLACWAGVGSVYQGFFQLLGTWCNYHLFSVGSSSWNIHR